MGPFLLVGLQDLVQYLVSTDNTFITVFLIPSRLLKFTVQSFILKTLERFQLACLGERRLLGV